jgi:tripartite-type tricarboxylate transporter receptor subunit TctC
MKKALGMNMVHVPYRGGAPMTTDLIAGMIPVGIDVLTAFVPYFKSGQLVPLAVTSANRSPLVPDVPSVVEAGHRSWCWTTSSACPGRRRCRPTWWRASMARATRSWPGGHQEEDARPGHRHPAYQPGRVHRLRQGAGGSWRPPSRAPG